MSPDELSTVASVSRCCSPACPLSPTGRQLHADGRWKIQLPISAIWRWKKGDTTSHICCMEVEDGRYNLQHLLYGGGYNFQHMLHGGEK